MVTVIKEAVNSRFGKVVEFRVTSGFKINAEGRTLTPEFLYDLLVLAYNTFMVEFIERTKGKHIAHYIVDKPLFNDNKRYLEIAIIGIGTNLQ